MINIVYESDCVGCPQGCINCGRSEKKPRAEMICDECGYEDEVLYKVDGQEVCIDCVKKLYAITEKMVLEERGLD